MKKSILTLALFGCLTASYAQNEDYRSTISVTAGLNVLQLIALIDDVNFEEDALTTQNLEISATPSFNFSYDYGFKKWFSLGGAVSWNRFKLGADRIVIDLEDRQYDGPLKLNANRINIAVRPLFHYANARKLDLYSGLRVGATIWSGSVDANQDLLPEDIIGFTRGSSVRPSVQVIPFGLRGYVTDNLGFGFELAIGAPHYAAVQLNYRIGGSGAKR